MDAVVLDIGPVPLDDLLAIARGAPVVLAGAVVDRLAAGRRVVDDVLAGGRAVYGLTTGVGSRRDTRVPDDQLVEAQYTIVRTHSGGFGPPLPTEVVRAAVAARLVGLTRGGSGASPAVAHALVGLLNAGVHPVLPRTSSVGAGDVGAMALVAQVAIGAGRAEYRGEVLDGGTALARAGLHPLRLGPRDGLALVSANGVSVGHGALVVARAGALVGVADLVLALTLEATRGNPSIVAPVVARARRSAGLADSCRRIRAALEGSPLLADGGPASVQDPLSSRVAPQVHGALRDTLGFTRRAVETELDAQADNPLLDPDEGALVSTGNFSPVLLAVACDALRVALAHTGQLSDRRMSHLWDAVLSGGAPAAGSAESLGMHLRYPAAAAAAELRQLAAPAGLDVGVLEHGVEDHGTAAPLAVRRTEEALDLLADVLTAELLLAGDLLAAREPPPALGQGTGRVLGTLRAALGERDDRNPAAVHATAREVLLSLEPGAAG